MCLPRMLETLRIPCALCLAGAALFLGACASEDAGSAAENGLSAEEMAAEPPRDRQAGASAPSQTAEPAGQDGPAPVLPFEGDAAPAARGNGVVLRLLAEGHIAPDATMTMSAMEQDLVYLTARVETEDGRAIADEEITVRTDSNAQILLDMARTDDYGYAAFTLFMREPGLAQFTLSAKGVETDFRVDAMSLEESPWLRGIQGEGITPWATLGNVDARFEDEALQTDFGDDIAALDGQRVKLAGYMMPISPDQRQTQFLISASPPDCFFHMPGGPTTLALVETDPERGIAMTMDPLTVEGRLRLERRAEDGVVYRLEDARLVESD